MNMKKILILGIILIVAGTLISTVSAENMITSNELTVNDIHFKIPDGFAQYEKETDTSNETDDDGADTEDIDGTAVDSKVTTDFKNGANQKLEITVGVLANDKKIESINPAGYEQKTIAGKEGFFKKEVDDGVDEFKFQYLQDGKLVKIQAPSEDMISQIIG